MTFRHERVLENRRLVASYCGNCQACVAVSTHESILVFSERKHLCRPEEDARGARESVPEQDSVPFQHGERGHGIGQFHTRNLRNQA